ncbi:MAG: hypothetical protein H8E64_00540 [Candidatus Marinimicrobia bacterium]|nr:hypothetical protein [Candidatus Neomarinimicrobiota bacterium]
MKNMTFFLILFASSIITGTVIHVPGDQPTIQAGIDYAVDSDTVLVAPGTYFENIIWPETNGIKLIGSGVNECFIDGSEGTNTIIRFDSPLIDLSTLLTGFTIQNGNNTAPG